MDKIEVNNKEKYGGPIAFLFFLVVFVSVVGLHNFNKYFISKNYPLSVYTACDPARYSCFETDPEIANAFQSVPYVKVEINAGSAPACLDEHTCENFNCNGITGQCFITYCSEETIEEGEFCSNQTQ